MAPKLLVPASLLVLAASPLLSDRGVEDVGDQIERLGYTHEVDEDGDYRLLVGFDEDERTQIVHVFAGTNDFGDAEIREVTAAAHRLTASDDDEELSAELLLANTQAILGSWARVGDLIYFVARIPADADDDVLEAAIAECAVRADQLEEELTGDADEL